MSDPIGPSASSMTALSQQYEAIAHNLANANTAGYKRRVTAFHQALRQASDVSLANIGSVTGQTAIDFSQAALAKTDRSLEFALSGEGFFTVETPDGPRYTRNGSFQVNPQGQLVDLSGQPISGGGGPITIPGGFPVDDIQVATDGTVRAGDQQIGKLAVVEFEDTSELVPVGGNCFIAPDGTTAKPAVGTKVHQGYKEPANFNVVEELVSLIMVTRMYEANAKYITTQDDQTKQILQVAMS